MRPSAVLVFLALLAGCAGPPAGGPALPNDPVVKPETAGGSAPTPPEVEMLASLPENLMPMRRQGQPERDTAPFVPSGAFVRYTAQDGHMTIFLGTRGTTPVPDGADSSAARQELNDHSILMVRTLAIASGGRAMPRTIGVSARGPSGSSIACNIAGTDTSQGGRYEAACVSGVLGRLLKTRMTISMPANAESAAGLMAIGLTAEIRARLLGEPPPAARPAPRPRGGPITRL